MSECKKLRHFVEAGVKRMREQKALNHVISDYVEDMGTGDAVICHECEQYEKCKTENGWDEE
jgi:hypothetical protein